MKVEESELNEVLRLAIFDANNRGKNFIDQIKKTMFNLYDMTGGEVAELLNGRIPIEIMSKDTKFKLTNVLYELNKNINSTFDTEELNKLNIDIYFTEKEKIDFSKKIDRQLQEEDIIIKAGNWMRVEDDQYVIKIYPDDLLKTYINKNKINYNPETQRDLSIKETKTGKIKTITFDSRAFNDIYNSMKNNLYISDTLALNINPDFNIPPKIVNGDIVISKDSKIDCIDGYHRLRAAITTKMSNPNWNKPLVFFLFICDVDKAVQYILQQDEKIHLSDEQTTRVDNIDAANFIIKKINTSNLYLRNTIDDTKAISLNKIINKIFEPKKIYKQADIIEPLNLYNMITNNMNAIIERDNLFNADVSKERWFVYLYIMKYCEDKNLDFLRVADKESVEKILDRITFKREPTNVNYKFMKEVINNV